MTTRTLYSAVEIMIVPTGFREGLGVDPLNQHKDGYE